MYAHDMPMSWHHVTITAKVEDVPEVAASEAPHNVASG